MAPAASATAPVRLCLSLQKLANLLDLLVERAIARLALRFDPVAGIDDRIDLRYLLNLRSRRYIRALHT